MEKTEGFKKVIKVIDEQGNEYDYTYPKRAKGLIKSGRARIIGDNIICLVCPPNSNLEENKMNNENILNEQKLDLNFIYNSINEIIEQGKDLNKEMSSETLPIIVAREKTNRQLIELLSEMLDRVYPKVDTFTINSNIITGLNNALETAIENDANDAQQTIINALLEIQKSTLNNK